MKKPNYVLFDRMLLKFITFNNLGTLELSCSDYNKRRADFPALSVSHHLVKYDIIVL